MTQTEYWWYTNRREIADDWSATRSWVKSNQELLRPLAEQDVVAMYDLDDPLVRTGLEAALGRRGVRAIRFLRLVRLAQAEAASMQESGTNGSAWAALADVCHLLGRPVPDREQYMRQARSTQWARHLATTKEEGGAR